MPCISSIPNQTPYFLGDSHGGPLFGYRFPSGICGPFHHISEFNSFLIHKYVLSDTRDNVAAIHSRTYRSVFTHADLDPTNILKLTMGVCLELWTGNAPASILRTGSLQSFFMAHSHPRKCRLSLVMHSKIHMRRNLKLRGICGVTRHLGYDISSDCMYTSMKPNLI